MGDNKLQVNCGLKIVVEWYNTLITYNYKALHCNAEMNECEYAYSKEKKDCFTCHFNPGQTEILRLIADTAGRFKNGLSLRIKINLF